MKKAILEICHVLKSFRHQSILSDDNMAIYEGELLYLCGKNENGRSTIFKITAGLLEPDTGTLNWVKEVKIGALIENPEYMGSETSFDNLRFLYQSTSPFHKQEVEMLVNKFNLALYNKKPLRKYSVGMFQKVGIIQAIVEHQDLIMFDELMCGLDKEAQQTFYEIVQEPHEEGKTVIIILHDIMDEIGFDRKLCVENGKITELQRKGDSCI